jgi:hypothetical protein
MNDDRPVQQIGSPSQKRQAVPKEPETSDLQVTFPMEMPLARSLGRGKWRIEEDWPFQINGKPFLVPGGFITDLYSVPWPLTLFIPRDEQDNRPSALHDAAYATVGFRKTKKDKGLTRAQCDLIILITALQCGLGLRRSLAIYLGVRIGGWVPFGKLKAAGYSLEKPMMD